MQIGDYSIEQLSEGLFILGFDGSIRKISAREATSGSDEDKMKYATPVGIDPILISGNSYNILLDAGLGMGMDSKNKDPKISNIKSNLEIFDLKPSDITHVILSHLHYDHIGGLTYTDSQFKTRETLPNAKYYVQRREWEHALSTLTEPDSDINGVGYHIDDLYRLVAKDKFVFIDDDHYPLMEGIDLIWTGGHTPGHQIVRISDEEQNIAYYLGDLIPSEEFLNYPMKKMDTDNRQARQMKLLWLRQAYREGAQLLFYHSTKKKFGKLSKDKYRKYVLQ